MNYDFKFARLVEYYMQVLRNHSSRGQDLPLGYTLKVAKRALRKSEYRESLSRAAPKADRA